ncbi:UNVERIFIED_CONTAM: hypothetical protein RMT77_013223 [Armadillidium vulgare]
MHCTSITDFNASLNNNIYPSSNIEGDRYMDRPKNSSQNALSIEITNDEKPTNIDTNTKSNEDSGSSNVNPQPSALHSLDCIRTRLNGCVYSRDRYLMGHYM